MATRNTPLTGFLFAFKIDEGPPDIDSTPSGGGMAFFRSIGGIKSDNEVTDYMEGGVTGFTRKVIGVRKWPNLVLKQGFTGDAKLFNWKWNPRRVNGQVIQLGPDMEEICRWKFTNGYPVKWEGPDFDAMKNEIAIETIEIAHEGLEFDNNAPPAEEEPQAQPPPPPPPPPLRAEAHFASGSATVTAPQPELDEAIATLKENPERKVKVEGHTDGDGSEASNMTLSQNRANNTKQYLINGGVDPGQITSATGYGESQPINPIPEKTAAEKAANRRTIVIDA